MSNHMKNTGIVWCPHINKNWDILKVKNCFYISKEKSNQIKPTILKLARDSIKIRDISNNEGQIAESYENYNIVKIGDFLLNPMDLYSGANCNVSEVLGVISPAYINLRAKVKLIPKYFDYYFKIQYWTMAMFAHGKGVSFENRWSINNETIKDYEVPFPNINTQEKIVKKINAKCIKIDTLIQNQQQQIEKLKQYKQSLITEIVTKGLEPNVTMKDSGVEWIGQIPKSVKLIDMRHLLNISTGNMDTKDSIDDGIYPLYVRSPIVEKCNNYTFEDEEAILMSGDGAGAGRIFHFVSGKYGCHQRVYRLNNFKYVLSKYLKYYLEVMFPKVVEQGNAKSTVDSIRLNMIKNFKVVVFDISTQEKVANYLDKKCSQIDNLIKIKEEKIQKLNDYKKSIIYEYVTGKKEA